MLSEFDDEHALLTANPHWSGPRGNVREIEIPFVAKSSEMIARWSNGEFDVLTVWNLTVAEAQETVAHINWLKRQPKFDLCLCLHEDWEAHGFYVYELNPEGQPSLAEKIVARVAEVCPIDTSELIEGRPAQKGIIRPSVDPRSRPQWPEAFFLLTHKTRLSYTLEAPSDFPLSVRVAALIAAVRGALEGKSET